MGFYFLDCVQAQVLYDFTAEPGNNELTVKEGETITITNQVIHYHCSSTIPSVYYKKMLGPNSATKQLCKCEFSTIRASLSAYVVCFDLQILS